MPGQLLQNPFRESGPKKTYTQQLIALFAWPKKKPVGHKGWKYRGNLAKTSWDAIESRTLLTLGRTRKFIPPPLYKRAGLIEPLPRFFGMLQYSETILPSVEAFDNLNKMRFILWVVALPEACEVTNNGRHLGRHLGFYQELETG